MSSVRSATSAAHQVPSHSGPSPGAAGAPFHVGRSSPGRSALPPPQRIAGLYTSFQPPGGLALGMLRHPDAAAPSALPHDSRIRNASPGRAHPAAMAGNSPVYSHGCKFIPPVADGAAGKPSCATSGRNPYFRYSIQGCIRARLHPGPHQPALQRVDRGLRLGASRRRAAGPAHPPRPHPGDERRELPPQAQQGKRRPASSGRLGQPISRAGSHPHSPAQPAASLPL